MIVLRNNFTRPKLNEYDFIKTTFFIEVYIYFFGSVIEVYIYLTLKESYIEINKK